jgi:hypothetical protein
MIFDNCDQMIIGCRNAASAFSKARGVVGLSSAC